MTNIRAASVDPDEFERFYREHLEAVQRFVARRVANPAVAAELTADVFVAVIEAAESYQPDRGSPRGWLFGIARNVIHSEYRRTARETRATERVIGQRTLAPDAMARAIERIDAEAAAREYVKHIASLPARLRDVLELVAVDGLTVTDAATALQITPATARVRLHRARKKLTASTARPTSAALVPGGQS